MSTTRKISSPDNTQFNLFGGVPESTKASGLKTAVDSGRRFVTGERNLIFLGATRLEEYLKQANQRTPFIVVDLLSKQDWDSFERRYASTGRAPYAPQLMMGLVLYGVMQGIHSLRELERMARLDLGCMWVTGGITPDHANIGRFIVMHEEELTTRFFESLTRSVLAITGSKSTRLAGDGTVIEAACSHYNLLKKEAIKERTVAAVEAVRNAPDDQEAQQELQASQQCQAIFEERESKRKSSGKSVESLCISASEPQAMVQRLKRGRGFAASYKPSVLANEDRIITAFAVDASSETKVVADMLDQSERVTGTEATELLADAGYFHNEVIKATLERDISLLCPEGQWPAKVQTEGLFHKSAFNYDESTNTYQCPAGHQLIMLYNYAETASSEAHRVYGSTRCQGCPLRDKCTRAVKGKRIKRYAEDEQRDALRLVMQQPQAKHIFSQRKAMVEPVFSALRCQQGLNRFRCKGLQAVKREFALHALAYNLSRAVALLWALFILFYAALRALRATAHHFLKCFFRFDGSRKKIYSTLLFKG